MLRVQLILGLLAFITMGQPHPVYAEHSAASPKTGDSSSGDIGIAIPTNDQTDQEKLLDKQNELDRSLQEFDEMLLRRKDILSRKNAGKGSAGTHSQQGAGYGTVGDGGNEEDTSGELGTTDGNQGSDVAGEESDQSGQGKTATESNDSIGGSGRGLGRNEDAPNSGDDDIVARQLREAAEKETDPTLKKKLWEEYRIYKKNGV